mmetsp:Transcript_3894/g.6855  ORF Transcript_3894/g.6855 Transcript_3894/m.6855 type:complete len:312 (+) Transcript_3894:229-1164(+)
MAWKCEGSGKVSASGSNVSAHVSKRGSVRLNAMWTHKKGLSGKNPAPQYFEITVEEGKNVWVGWTTPRGFHDGWKCKSLSYGSNLSDGSGLKRQNYGPPIKAGDTVGLWAAFETAPKGSSSSLVVKFSHNGAGLGPAFVLANMKGKSSMEFFPMVAFSGNGRATIQEPASVPSSTALDPNPNQRSSRLGAWKADTRDILEGENSNGNVPQEIVFQVAENRIGATVGNQMGCGLSPEPPFSSMGHVMSTRMMPAPHLVPLEASISSLLGSITALDFSNGHLHISYGDPSKTILLKPFHVEVEPVPQSEVSWL